MRQRSDPRPQNAAPLLITGSDENAFVPMKRSAVAAMVVFEVQSMVPRFPASAGTDNRPSVPAKGSAEGLWWRRKHY